MAKLIDELFPEPMGRACMIAAEKNLREGNLCQDKHCDKPVEYEHVIKNVKLCKEHWELAMPGEWEIDLIGD